MGLTINGEQFPMSLSDPRSLTCHHLLLLAHWESSLRVSTCEARPPSQRHLWEASLRVSMCVSHILPLRGIFESINVWTPSSLSEECLHEAAIICLTESSSTHPTNWMSTINKDPHQLQSASVSSEGSLLVHDTISATQHIKGHHTINLEECLLHHVGRSII